MDSDTVVRRIFTAFSDGSRHRIVCLGTYALAHLCVTPNAPMQYRSATLRFSDWDALAATPRCTAASSGGRVRMLHTDTTVDEKSSTFGLCGNCGLGSLELVDERPHPMLGIVGKVVRTLRCDAAGCGSYLVETD